MPGFDGTGPTGQGPFTGGGRGYCMVQLPNASYSENIIGYAGYAGKPISLTAGNAIPMLKGPNLSLAPRGCRRQLWGRRRFRRLVR